MFWVNCLNEAVSEKTQRQSFGRYCHVCVLGELKVIQQVWHEEDQFLTGCDVAYLDGEDENNIVQ